MSLLGWSVLSPWPPTATSGCEDTIQRRVGFVFVTFKEVFIRALHSMLAVKGLMRNRLCVCLSGRETFFQIKMWLGRIPLLPSFPSQEIQS